MADKITILPCATYRTDIPRSLRALADQIESGEAPTPESLIMIASSDEGVTVYSQGLRADDDVFTVGLLEFGKGLITSGHAE